MQTLKTALVVTFLLAVLYGVFITLNKPETTGDDDRFDPIGEFAGPDIELEAPGVGESGFDPRGQYNETPAGPPSLGTPSSDFPLPDFGESASNSIAAPAELGSRYADAVPAPPLSEPAGTPAPIDPTGPYGVVDSAEASLGGSDPNGSIYGSPADSSLADSPYTDTAPSGNAYDPGNEYNAGPYADQRVDPARNAGDDQFNDPAPAFEPNATDSYATDPATIESQAKLAEYNFREAWGEAQRHLDANDYAQALAVLTTVYREKHLPTEQRGQLLETLDQLAGDVIYRIDHRLEPPYTVAQGETLEQIANAYQVPSQLLFNINRANISSPDLLLAGTQLKVMRGPFRAEIEIDETDPSRGEATLFLHTLYAGRFPVSFGSDLPTPGRTYQVTERLEGKTFYQASGPPLQARSPNNPYGSHWIGLNDSGVGLHGGSRTAGDSDPRGSIRLSDRDAADVFGILSVGSVVKILE